MPGWDPELDGTAAKGIEFQVKFLPDGTWEVISPDGEIGLYADFDATRRAVVAWLMANGWPEPDDG